MTATNRKQDAEPPLAAGNRPILLSPPSVGDVERGLLLEAFDSGWIAPLGPQVDLFEAEFAAAVGVDHAAALSSGTAALHLAMLIQNVGPGDEVLVPTLTFIATAAAVTYVGARPVFIDCDPATWTLDTTRLEQHLASRSRLGRLPAAVITVDLYGQCADYDSIIEVCDRFGVAVVEDAAEALGATYRGRPAGSLAPVAVFSFNGNKVITTSGGGMLVSTDEEWVARARYLSTQARQPVLHYEHTEIGFNYRMSNLLAAVGRGQLKSLRDRVAHRQTLNTAYREALAEVPGVTFMPKAPYGESSWWLTCVLIDEEKFGASRDDVQTALRGQNIESRPTWKPLHLQPVFGEAERIGGSVAEAIFRNGLCLPSGFGLDEGDVNRVCTALLQVPGGIKPGGAA